MRTLGLAIACCLALLSAPSSAQTRAVPAAHVDVSKTETALPGPTYTWVPMPGQVQAEFDRRVQDPKLRTRLQAALDRALQAKGYRRTDDLAQADIAIAYRVGVRDVQQTQVRESGLASAREAAVECRSDGCSQIVTQGANGVPTIKVHTIDTVEGGLMVEVLQPADIRVLWRALYRGSVRAKDRRPVDLDAIATQTLVDLPRAPAR